MSQQMYSEFNFMCANDSNDEHLNDESMVRMGNKVRHVGTKDRQRSQKVRMRCPTTAVALSDCSHPFRDFVSSTLSYGFETIF